MTTPFEFLTKGSERRMTLIWDLPTRVAHWVLVSSVIGAWLTSDSERLIVIHSAFGYTIGAILVFRFSWGFLGSKYARWSTFYPSVKGVRSYLSSLLRASPEHHVGHNPLGAVAIFVMLTLLGGLVITGWIGFVLTQDDLITEFHEALASALLVVIWLHVLGVVFSSLVHRQNLIRSMIRGHKDEVEATGIESSHSFVGYSLLSLAIICFVYFAYFSAP